MQKNTATPIEIPVLPVSTASLTSSDKVTIEIIRKRLKEKNIALIAHYYTPESIQILADASDGFIGDSLAMAQFGYAHSAQTLLIAGVRFMGESAKILSPQKKVLMPTLQAECSLDLGCPYDAFDAFCNEHKDRTVVVYANTSAAVKARADWVVTSSNAVEIIKHLHAKGEKILWAPDRYLGAYIKKQVNADMLLWNGACIVHEEFKATGLRLFKEQYPEAAILVHPESPESIIEMADVVGSTTKLLKASQSLPHTTFIVATDAGLFYKMQQASPYKTFISAPTAGVGGTCKSCAHCPWMAMNTLDAVLEAIEKEIPSIELENTLISAAKRPLLRMLNFQL